MRFLSWLFSARTLLRGLMALACMVALIALCYGVIDLSDGHAWNEYRSNYAAHVAPLEMQAYVPKPVSDSENFASTPFVQSWFKKNGNILFDHDAYKRANDLTGSFKQARPGREFADLVGWQEAFAAAAAHATKPDGGFRSRNLDLASRAQAAPLVLDELKDDTEVLDELRAASARSDARYPVVYDMDQPWNILLPHLAKIKQACLRLQLKADAELALGENENALADVKLMLYLADSLKTEPFLISYLVRIACLHIAIDPIWEGLAEHRWTDAQLQQLQASLEPDNFLADMQWSLHAERVFGVLCVDLLKKKGLGFLTELDGAGRRDKRRPTLNLLGRIIPDGWYDLEKLQYCVAYDAQFKGAVDKTAKRVFPRQIAETGREMKARSYTLWTTVLRHQVILSVMLPSLDKIPIKAAAAQVASDQASVACALERYRLANRHFPDTLQALVPRFIAQLPNDPISGEVYQYRPTDDGKFILYSVGWNEKDDGGIPGKIMFDDANGDWVW